MQTVPVQHMISLTTEPPSRFERRVATAAIAVSVVLFVALAPFAKVQVGRTDLFLPTYESALAMCDFITCVFLFGQFGLSRSPALLILAGGYLFSAVMALLHEVSFPGLFTRAGLVWAGPQTTAWLYFLWHLGFPAAVIAFALGSDHRAASARSRARWAMPAAVLGALALAALALLISTVGAHYLPRLMNGNHDRPAKYAVAWVTSLITLATLPLLWRRTRSSALHLWLLVVIVAWSCDIAQASVFNAGRFSFGWYTGRAYGLAASSFLLVVLIVESGRLYRRLAESHAIELELRRFAERRTEQLDHLTDSLEERIRERTQELERANEALRCTRDELRKAATVGAAARESERTRLARELHDELGQALLMLKFQLADLDAYCLERRTPVVQKTHAMRCLIDQTFEAAKRVAADLRPSVLDVLGLPAAVRWLVQRFRQHNAVDVQLRIDPPDFDLGEPCATAVFRVLQEALTNIARHAQAAHVEVELALEDGEVRVRVSDDGRGFDVATPSRADAFGLLGMRERMAMVSGALQITSALGRGTTVALSIPLSALSGAPGGESAP